MSRMHKLAPRHLRGSRFRRPGTWLVRFSAPWCAWCRSIDPVLERMAAERRDLSIGTILIDEDEELVDQYRLFTLPTLILFRDGREVARREGPLSPVALAAWISHWAVDPQVARVG
jgi:thioredoxin 1